VPPKDIRALGDAIGRLVGDAGLRSRMAIHARASALAFEETKVMGDFAAIVDRLTA